MRLTCRFNTGKCLFIVGKSVSITMCPFKTPEKWCYTAGYSNALTDSPPLLIIGMFINLHRIKRLVNRGNMKPYIIGRMTGVFQLASEIYQKLKPSESKSMEFRDRFRNLISNHYMDDFDYLYSKNSFRTVFYKSSYSYCCCECSFNHEYMFYLKDKGHIDEDMFENVVSNITSGECPHVSQVPPEYIKETDIRGLHIHVAAAVSTETVLRWHKQQLDLTTGIFRLTPCALAVIKGGSEVCKILFNCHIGYSHLSEMYLYASKSNSNNVNMKPVYLLELTVQTRNIQLLKDMLISLSIIPSGIPQALMHVFKNGWLDEQEILVKYIQSLAANCKIVNVLLLAEVAVAFDKPEVLEKFLENIPSKHRYGALKYWLWKTCCILQREKCKTIISKYDISDSEEKSTLQPVNLSLLEMLYDSFNYEEISSLLKCSNSLLFQSGFRFQAYLNPDKRRIDKRLLSTMFDLGYDVNSVGENGRSILLHFLENGCGCYMTHKNFMAVLQSLIYENPRTDVNKTAVALGLKVDAKLTQPEWNKLEYEMEGDFITDLNIHSVFGGNDVEAKHFVCPLLLESGFEPDKNILRYAVEDGILHSAELEYFKSYIDDIRPLMLKCRDVLRRHFVGRKLHSYIDSQILPQKIKDFVLIKSYM